MRVAIVFGPRRGRGRNVRRLTVHARETKDVFPSKQATRTLPSPGDPQAYYKLLVGGPKGRAPGGVTVPRGMTPAGLSTAFREAAGRAGQRLAEARRRLAA